MTHVLIFIGFAACSFLWGGIPIGYIVVKLLKGTDLRTLGSGNIGATNVRRVLGTAWFFAVLALDAAKGAAPVLLSLMFGFDGFARILIAASTIGGNLFSLWLGFKGGKGIGTGLGALLILAPFPMAACLIVFVIALLTLNYVSVASVIAASVFPIAIFAAESVKKVRHDTALLVFAVILALALAVVHRANLARFARGTENKFFIRELDVVPRSPSATSAPPPYPQARIHAFRLHACISLVQRRCQFQIGFECRGFRRFTGFNYQPILARKRILE